MKLLDKFMSCQFVLLKILVKHPENNINLGHHVNLRYHSCCQVLVLSEIFMLQSR